MTIINLAHLVKIIRITWVKNIRTIKSSGPITTIDCNPIFSIFSNAVRHHSAIAGKHGTHAKFAHTGKNITAKFLLALVPPIGITVHGKTCGINCGTPPLEVIHGPPRLKAGAGDKCVNIICREAQLFENTLPHNIKTNHLKRHIYAMQSHPVNLLLPTLPRPKSHRIGKGAIVQIIAIIGRSLVHLLSRRNRKIRRNKVGFRIVPCQIYMCMMIEIPIYSRCQCRQR